MLTGPVHDKTCPAGPATLRHPVAGRVCANVDRCSRPESAKWHGTMSIPGQRRELPENSPLKCLMPGRQFKAY